ncbi:MAG: ethylbenzene dehydrogenase-related protein [Rhodothermales bacterium]
MKALIQSVCLLLIILIPTTDVSAQKTLFAQPGEPTMDGVISPGEWTSTPLITTRGVTLNAMADGDYLYLAASWSDATENTATNRLTYDGSQWTQDGDEDRIAFLFDMGQTGTSGANCQAFCHFPSMSTNGGVVDVWNWKAASSNPMGYAEDNYWDASGQKIDEGITAVLVNSLDGQNLPSFMASSGAGAIKEFLVENATALDAFDPYETLPTQSVDEAVNFNSSMTFSANDYVSAFVHRIPSGDVADIRSAGKYDNGTWTVEFKRPYDGGDHDFTVNPGGSVTFTHEVFDNQGGDHALDSTPLDVNIYTLDFSAVATTSIDRLADEVPASFELMQNYPNPFNPSTTITFDIPASGLAKLEVINVLGQVVATLVNEVVQPGQYQLTFDAQSLPSGNYYYRLTSENFSAAKQMTLMK